MSNKYPKVVDIYYLNEVKSFDSIKKSGVMGIIHKSSQGSSFKDKLYSKRKVQAKQAGLLWGAYHFASKENVDDQIKNFLDAAEYTKDSDMLLALDYEENKKQGTMNISQCREFLQKIYEKTGKYAVLYSGNLIKETLPKYDDFFAKHRLWLAQYGPRAVLPKSWDNYWLWQYAADGIGQEPASIPGLVDGNQADVNWFDGSDDELKNSWLG